MTKSGLLRRFASRNDALVSRQMPPHLRAPLQGSTLPCDNLGDAFGGEVHVDEAGRGIGDLVIFDDLAFVEFHDRDALEHRARPVSLRQRRAIAERVARIERVPVADRCMHVPAKIRCRAIEPVVDQFGDFRPPGKRAVKRIMIDPVFGEQLGKCRTLVLFNGVTEDAQHGGSVHSVLPIPRQGSLSACDTSRTMVAEFGEPLRRTQSNLRHGRDHSRDILRPR
jgi:hypothetical protein